MCSKISTGASRGAEPFMQNCVTNSFTPLSFLMEMKLITNTVCHTLSNRHRRITTDAAAISQTTSVICAHSPVSDWKCLNAFPDCWPSEGRCAFIVTESKWILRKFTFCRGWRLAVLPVYSETKGLELSRFVDFSRLVDFEKSSTSFCSRRLTAKYRKCRHFTDENP